MALRDVGPSARPARLPIGYASVYLVMEQLVSSVITYTAIALPSLVRQLVSDNADGMRSFS